MTVNHANHNVVAMKKHHRLPMTVNHANHNVVAMKNTIASLWQ